MQKLSILRRSEKRSRQRATGDLAAFGLWAHHPCWVWRGHRGVHCESILCCTPVARPATIVWIRCPMHFEPPCLLTHRVCQSNGPGCCRLQTSPSRSRRRIRRPSSTFWSSTTPQATAGRSTSASRLQVRARPQYCFLWSVGVQHSGLLPPESYTFM